MFSSFFLLFILLEGLFYPLVCMKNSDEWDFLWAVDTLPIGKLFSLDYRSVVGPDTVAIAAIRSIFTYHSTILRRGRYETR
jgi:hypothetical protein